MEGNNGTMVCKSCGAELTEGKNFCPSCGAQQNEPEAQNIQQSAPTEKACAACGSMMGAAQQFCPVCGTAASVDGPQQAKKKTNKKIIWAIAAVGVIILAVVLFFVIRGVPVDSVRLNKTSVTLKVGEKVELKYTISPENAKNQEVSWSTSNNDVVEVTDGTILGLEEGSCVVTVKSSNGKTAECDVIIEPAGPDFAEIAETLGNPSFLVVASDGSYMSFDTNPSDIDDYVDYEAYLSIVTINELLGLPESVFTKMGETRSIDGRVQEEFDDVKVSWTYHPDKGLEVMYEAK